MIHLVDMQGDSRLALIAFNDSVCEKKMKYEFMTSFYTENLIAPRPQS